jgi:hypothetical protein
LLSFAHRDHPLVLFRTQQRCIESTRASTNVCIWIAMYCYNVSLASMFQPDFTLAATALKFRSLPFPCSCSLAEEYTWVTCKDAGWVIVPLQLTRLS